MGSTIRPGLRIPDERRLVLPLDPRVIDGPNTVVAPSAQRAQTDGGLIGKRVVPKYTSVSGISERKGEQLIALTQF